ncbi:unnamed protein product [Aphis gossypii]|nr:unnamed protein product [Aphis gossypii]
MAILMTSYLRLTLQDKNLPDHGIQGKTQRDGVAANDSPAAAYLPAYAIPDGSPVDPCVTCRPRRTTHNCRRNTLDGCPSRPSSTCGTTKRCKSQARTRSTKRLCSSSSSRPASFSSTKKTMKRSNRSSIRVKPNHTGLKDLNF